MAVKGTGLGLVSQGEGTGAAQKFGPSRAAATQAQLAQGLIRQSAKKRAARTRTFDPTFGDWSKDVPYFQKLYQNIQGAISQAGEITPEIQKGIQMAEAAAVVQTDQKFAFKEYLERAETLLDAGRISPEDYEKAQVTANQYASIGNPMQRMGNELPTFQLLPEEEVYDFYSSLDAMSKDQGIPTVTIEKGERTVTTKKATQADIDTRFNAWKTTPEGKFGIKTLTELGIENPEEKLKKYYVSGLDSQYKELYDEEKGGLDINFGAGTGSAGGWSWFYQGETDDTPTPFGAQWVEGPVDDKIVFTAAKGKEPTFTSFTVRYNPNDTDKSSNNPFLQDAFADLGTNAVRQGAGGLYSAVGFKPNLVERRGDKFVVYGRIQYPNADGVQKVKQGPITLEEGVNKEEFEKQFLGGVDIEEFMDKSKAGKDNSKFKGVPKGGF